jgi:ATP-dependent Lon protease
MEIIRIPGYLENEKMQIGRRFLCPRTSSSTA